MRNLCTEKAEDVSNISHAIEDYEDQQKTTLLAIQFNPELRTEDIERNYKMSKPTDNGMQ